MTFRPNRAGFAEVERAVHGFGVSVADRIADAARANVAVDTGATRDSIEVVDESGDAIVRVGGAGLFLELGTAHMAAEPFLQPAADDVAREVPAMAREQLGAER